MEKRKWVREELILAINLYCKLPFGQLHKGNSEIINLSQLIKRTPSAVAWKLVNFASLDPSLQKRGIKGAKHRSKMDEEIWNEFYKDWENLSYESEVIRAKYRKIPIDISSGIDRTNLPKSGDEREAIIKIRINQNFFRKTILSSYNYKCCITGIPTIELLVASHIKPWSADINNRLNPRNGLCLNALHDKAFDRGLITISSDFKLVVSKFIKENFTNKSISHFFKRFENKKIKIPNRFLPDKELLEYHQNNIFID